jgi:hypothetical protein
MGSESWSGMMALNISASLKMTSFMARELTNGKTIKFTSAAG